MLMSFKNFGVMEVAKGGQGCQGLSRQKGLGDAGQATVSLGGWPPEGSSAIRKEVQAQEQGKVTRGGS